MRSLRDRIRHAVSFEIIGLFLITPLGAFVFGMPVHDIGIVAVVSATIATLWNFVFNYVFDLALRRFSGTTEKTSLVRVLHALMFEAGLLATLMPFIACYLGVSLWRAFVMDVSFALFYVAYALVFNLAYDRLFPLPEWRIAERKVAR